MDWVKKLLFLRSIKKVKSTVDLPTFPDFDAAGVLFTDECHVLAGYQPNKTNPKITGIGGKRIDDEHYMKTALRECIEELFEVDTVPLELIEHIQTSTTPLDYFMNKQYVTIVYSFDTLEAILSLAKKHGIKSPLYSTHPYTLMDLIFHREHTYTSEIGAFALLPACYYNGITQIIDVDYLNDIQLYKVRKIKAEYPVHL
jgi:hypothetical protein